jgi:hypothetical protein
MKKKMLLNRRKKLRCGRITTSRAAVARQPGLPGSVSPRQTVRRWDMSKDETETAQSYDRAREMTEKALDAFVEGDEKTGGKLVDQAKGLNEAAVRDVHQELEEDAASEHDPEKLSQSGATNKSN